jgi:hypothetical protein
MRNRIIMLSGLVVLALLCTTGIATAQVDPLTITPDNSVPAGLSVQGDSIGADNALYGLKIAMEDLDESFTFNQTERLEKRMNHANLRLTEVQRQLETNRTQYAGRALDLYQQKLNLTKNSLADIPSNATGLLHAQEMTAKHEQVLANLMLSHPNNTGLVRAHDNSLMLGQKFEEKNAIRLGRTSRQGNVTPQGTYREEVQEQNRAGNGDGVHNQTEEQVRNEQREKAQVNKNTSPDPTTITTQPAKTSPAPTVTGQARNNAGGSDDHGENNGNGNGNADAGGQGKSKGR